MCPLCGHHASYIGLNILECANNECANYSLRLDNCCKDHLGTSYNTFTKCACGQEYSWTDHGWVRI